MNLVTNPLTHQILAMLFIIIALIVAACCFTANKQLKLKEGLMPLSEIIEEENRMNE